MLSHILARAITLPFQHGFLPTRWCTAFQFMLEKEPGNPLITKLRVIQLLEADMNFAFSLLWGKRLVHHALSHNALNPLNFGGRPGCRAHSALLLKTLSYDYICCTRLNAIISIMMPRLASIGSFLPLGSWPQNNLVCHSLPQPACWLSLKA